MINIRILKIETLSNNVRRVEVEYEDHRFPGNKLTDTFDVNKYGLVSFYDFGKSRTCDTEETALILSTLKAA